MRGNHRIGNDENAHGSGAFGGARKFTAGCAWLETAAQQVVQLPDVATVRHAGHGFYSDLLERGVRIFEYQAAVLHAKTLVADGFLSAVGSSNLDFRSFELNAECNFLFACEETGRAMEEQYEKDIARSEEIRLPSWRTRGALHRAGDALARRLAPVL